jgi:MYXO-CTERM domain-containing protein
VGTDQAAGGHGWELDDIAFAGITNTPFAVVVTDQRLCWYPVADAGPDQTVRPGQAVVLSGAGARDPRGGDLAYRWAQVGGPAVTLDASDAVTATFTAPDVSALTAVTFRLTVSTAIGSDSDEVEITVDPDAETPDGGVDGGTDPLTPGRGCGCATGSSGDSSGPAPFPAVLLLLLFVALRLVRRRPS